MTSRTRPQRRALRVAAGLLAAAVGVGLSAGPVPAGPASPAPPGGAPRHFTPVTGVKFNNPLGTTRQKLRLVRQVVRAIDSVPRGGTIRAAVYSFADQGTAEALAAAARRGVKVRVVVDGARQFGSVTYLMGRLGTDTAKRSYVVLCQASCRGTRGQMHAKFFQFTRVGDARKVTMVGSNNLTRHNSDEQWSDLYTQVGDVAYYRAFRHWFGELRRDTPLADPYEQVQAGEDSIAFTPLDLRVHPDPLLQALEPVGCTTATGDRTAVRIASSAWNGERGKAVARRVGALVGEGCDVRIMLGPGTGAAVLAILQDAGARLTTGTHRGIYTHEKLMVVSGRYGADDHAYRVWTGSHNWSDRALRRDDILVGLTSRTVAREYIVAFDRMWSLA